MGHDDSGAGGFPVVEAEQGELGFAQEVQLHKLVGERSAEFFPLPHGVVRLLAGRHFVTQAGVEGDLQGQVVAGLASHVAVAFLWNR